MTFDNFNDYIRDKCNYETIYADAEGRVILVITLLDAYNMTNRAPKEWVGLTDEEITQCSYDADGFMIDRELAMRAVEAKIKEKNGAL